MIRLFITPIKKTVTQLQMNTKMSLWFQVDFNSFFFLQLSQDIGQYVEIPVVDEDASESTPEDRAEEAKTEDTLTKSAEEEISYRRHPNPMLPWKF